MTLCAHDTCEKNKKGVCELTLCKHIQDANVRRELLEHLNTNLYRVNGKTYKNLSTIALDFDVSLSLLRKLIINDDRTLKDALKICITQRNKEKEEHRKNSLDKEIANKRAEQAEKELGLDDIINKAKSDDFGMDEP